MYYLVVVSPIRRLLAIGDVHAEDRRLAEVLGSSLPGTVDLVLSVGDVVDGPGDVERTCALLREHRVTTIRGNHERWLLTGEMRHLPFAHQTVTPETRAFLEALPTNLELETIAGRMLVSHGVGADDEAWLVPETHGYALRDAVAPVRDRIDVRYFLGGHTHVPMVRVLDDQVFINAGTLYRKDEPQVMVLDFEAGTATLHPVPEDAPPGPPDAVLDVPID